MNQIVIIYFPANCEKLVNQCGCLWQGGNLTPNNSLFTFGEITPEIWWHYKKELIDPFHSLLPNNEKQTEFVWTRVVSSVLVYATPRPACVYC